MAVQGIVTLTDRGGTHNPIDLDHSGATPSWVINSPGYFSCVITDEDALKWGGGADNWVRRKWLYYRHPELPTWGGIVLSVEYTSDGRCRLTAISFLALLWRRCVVRDYGKQRATAGALARRAYSDVQADDGSYIASFSADEAGEPVEFEFRGGDLMTDIFPQLASASGQEYFVDADRNFYWRGRLGTDKSGTVSLVSPHEIIGYSYVADGQEMINDLQGVASDSTYADSAYVRRDDEDSVRRYGRLMTSNRYPDVTSKGTLYPKVMLDLKRLKNPTQVIQVTMSDADHPRLWGQYDLGDNVQLILPRAGVNLSARIGARSVDIDQGTESLGMIVP